MEIVFGVVGGLGIFLLGLKFLSEGMQAVAGNSLRKMISSVTDNRFMATGVGTLVTCVVQSSSITTVLVVGSVNSGVMKLSQSLGVIMGANVGTTITGWILVLKVGKYGLPLLGVMAIAYIFSKNDRWKFWSLALMGIGMIFFGLETMKHACAVIKELPEFEAWLHRFQADNYFGIFKCIMIGCILTMMVQSSSATLGITISLAYQGVISYDTAAALVLGENIGTTITAYLASIGATVNARRAAYFHVIFNVSGVIWIFILFPWYTDMIQSITDGNVYEAVSEAELADDASSDDGDDSADSDEDESDTAESAGDEQADANLVYPATTAAIAATHTVFNIANVLLFLPFIGYFVRLLERLVPTKDAKEQAHLGDVELKMSETPPLAIEQSRNEIIKMAAGCEEMLKWYNELLSQQQPDDAIIARMQRREEALDRIQEEVRVFVTRLVTGNVSKKVAEEARQQLRIAGELESISDSIRQLMKALRRLTKHQQQFTAGQVEVLTTIHHEVASTMKRVVDGFRERSEADTTGEPFDLKPIFKAIKRTRKEHYESIGEVELSADNHVAFSATINAYLRVLEYLENIGQTLDD